MKSFSVKALVLALVVVGSANAKFRDYEYSDNDSIITKTLKKADAKIFGGFLINTDRNEVEHITGFPVFRNTLNCTSPYARAAVVAGAAAVATGVVVGAVVAVRAAYKKYVAKPAVEAEGEKTEANANAEATK